MELHEIRREIRNVMATEGIDSPRLTELIRERDRLAAIEQREELSPAESHARMLDYTFG